MGLLTGTNCGRAGEWGINGGEGVSMEARVVAVAVVLPWFILPILSRQLLRQPDQHHPHCLVCSSLQSTGTPVTASPACKSLHALHEILPSAHAAIAAARAAGPAPSGAHGHVDQAGPCCLRSLRRESCPPKKHNMSRVARSHQHASVCLTHPPPHALPPPWNLRVQLSRPREQQGLHRLVRIGMWTKLDPSSPSLQPMINTVSHELSGPASGVHF